jgi:PilZ domain-containing protein
MGHLTLPEGQGVDERRRHQRTGVSWPVRLWIDGDAIIGRAVDASAYGIGLVTPATALLSLGSSYRLDVLPGNRAEVSCVGEIRHLSGHRVGIETDRLLPLRTDELIQ